MMSGKKTKIILIVVIVIIAVGGLAFFLKRNLYILDENLMWKWNIFEEALNRKLTDTPDQVLVVASKGGEFGLPEDTRAAYYSVFTDRTITVKRGMVVNVPELETPVASRQLTQEEDDALRETITESGVLLLAEDISNHDIMDGGSADMRFTLQDGSEFETGGYMPESECFHEMFSYIEDLVTDEMWNELNDREEEYYAVYNEKPLYYDFYQQISDLGLSVAEAQLEKIENRAQFFSDLEDVRERWPIKGAYDPVTDCYKYDGNYALKIQDDIVQVYVYDEYAGTFEILDMSEIYADIIEECKITATEEQLCAAGREFLWDAQHINHAEYTYVNAYLRQDTHIVDGKQVNEISFWDRDYSFVREDGNWNYYIQGEKVGSIAYVPPMEYFKEEVEKYSITCSEDLFFTMPFGGFGGIFSIIEEFQKRGTDALWYFEYDEETNTYSNLIDEGEIRYAFVGVSDTEYDIIIKDEKIGSFTVDPSLWGE